MAVPEKPAVRKAAPVQPSAVTNRTPSSTQPRSSTKPAVKPHRKALSRSAINFLWDAWLLLNLLAVLWTRVVTAVIVRPAAEAGAIVRLWGWSWHDWDRLNLVLTALFAVSILVHLILHWTWVTQFLHQRYRRWRGGGGAPLHTGLQTIYGVAFLIVVLTLLGCLLAVAAIMAGPV